MLAMMYRLRSKILSFNSHFDINDADGNLAYQVIGKLLSFGHDLSFQQADGTEVAQIRQRLFRFLPTYELHLGAKHFATITREFSWFKKRFTLDIPGPNDYTIEGDFWNYEYEFRRLNRTVARVSRSFWSMADTYGVDVIEGEDDVSILAAVVVVSLCNQADSNH
jgi:uncharacterized protein YxjI